MPRYQQEATQEELQELALLLGELRSRGLELPKDVLSKKLVWPVDNSGYFTKLDGKFFQPREELENFIKSNARFVALVSGRGGGKTAAGAQKALQKIMAGENGAVLNPDFENFKLSTWPEFREWIPWDLVVPVHRHRRNAEWTPNQPFKMVFRNGVFVWCKGLKDPDSARGPNINWLWYDEAGRDRDGLAWQTAVASVRVGNDPQAWITSTPRGRVHWQYKFFEKQDIPQDAIELFEREGGGRELIESFSTSIEENKSNLDIGFYASVLATYPVGWLRDQEVYGKYVDEHGSLGDRSWFNGKVLPEPWETVEKRVRFWDLAATEKKTTGKKSNDPDETVGSKVASRPFANDTKNKEFCVENQIGGCWEWDEIKYNILRTAELDGPFVEIWIEQEPASGGKNQVAELKNTIRDNLGIQYKVDGYPPEGDRVMAANVWFAEAAQGRWYLVQGNWNELFLDQLSGFPDNTEHDDRVTSVSGARLKVAPIIRKWKNIPFLRV